MIRSLVLFLLLRSLSPASSSAPPVPAAAQASRHFDAQAATNAWLNTIPEANKAKSDAYFEGTCWLALWDFLYGAGVMLMLLETHLSARMRDWAGRVTGSFALQSVVYTLELVLVTAILMFPLTLYEGFWRERQYGLSNQDFGAWMRDQVLGLLVGLVAGALAGCIFLTMARQFAKTWHLWMIGAAVVFFTFGIVIEPVFLAPLFNTYRPLGNGSIKQQILSMARANGIPAGDVYEVDASRQSKRVSANVSGMFGSDRISLNDNLLSRCSPQAVKAVMGHEMGHYVLHHIYYSLLILGIAAAIAFALLRWFLGRALGRWGARWQLRGVSDPAVLPLAVLILSSMGFLGTPVSNTLTRMQEYEADIFGLNEAREPDGEAEVDVLLGEYRKMDPTPLEEFLFFDHPSGRTRIGAAMRWKAENLCLFNTALPCSDGAASPRQASESGVPTGH